MTDQQDLYILPNWPAPESVKAYVSNRAGGVSVSPFDSLNLGMHVQDDAESVRENRRLFSEATDMPDSLVWLNQVHGTDVVQLPCDNTPESADAAFSSMKDQVCAVLTADCLPVFFCDESGGQVAVAHAGWRGLCSGVLESTLACFEKADQVMAWLGPAIGPAAFEVGGEVREAFIEMLPEADKAFKPANESGKWLGDLYLLARQRLAAAGVTQVYGGDYCTFTEKHQFFSYRREGKTGRMASVIWLSP
ncbi:peptidoglycan editing factor PgeF [Marinomonas sp. C2222]|uniref:Purine nucleoside phosphorylase n=1 Tax=Marinomonas sargassi TaxID=2984494 RepID=A0ABT2YV20_9GAMM|nr:peptidoglycan editing factor PgeF [Marinomonas sargassi]MCV2403729.1 peptidoglycan editing factor PgeF [Marinomonas sargassi]